MASPSNDLLIESLRRTRRWPQKGDVFVYRLKGHHYGFGRVVVTDIGMFFDDDRLILIYIYDAFSPTMSNVPTLRKEMLLIPPVFVSRRPWTKGYFQTVRSEGLRREDRWPRHCFYDAAHFRYVDECGKRVMRRTDPCGDYGLSFIGAVEVCIRRALGELPPLSEGPHEIRE